MPQVQLRRLPRAAFCFPNQPEKQARQALAKVIQERLSLVFGAVGTYKPFFVRAIIVRLSINERNFVVAIKQGATKKPTDNWKIRVEPLDYPSRLKSMSDRNQRSFAKDLIEICKVVHTALGVNPEVTNLRWYFVGWNPMRPGVSTPEELPWHLEIPELQGGT